MSALQPITKVSITQVPNSTYPTRNKTFVLPFINEVEIDSSWKNLTDTAKVTVPYNVKVKNADGTLVTFGGNIFASTASGTVPLLMRGDKINISMGYFAQQKDKKYRTVMSTLRWWDGKTGSNLIEPTENIFSGFITKIENKKPITIECQDNMYLLKQVQCPNKDFMADKYSVQTMLQELLNSSDLTKHLTVQDGFGASAITTSVGNYRTLNATIAQVLENLRKDFKLECYFRGDQLRASGIVYFPPDRVEHNFDFQLNIISSSLNYTRLDDIQLGIKAYSVNKITLKKTTSRGSLVTKNERIEEFAGSKGGEIRTLYFWNVKDKQTLKKMAEQRLKRFFYEGWKGTFTSFGQPCVKHGDAAVLKDNILPERSGTYLIKCVKTTSGMNGYRQDIELDVRIDQFAPAELENGL